MERRGSVVDRGPGTRVCMSASRLVACGIRGFGGMSGVRGVHRDAHAYANAHAHMRICVRHNHGEGLDACTPGSK